MTTTRNQPAPIPDLVLERYHLGELPAATADRVRAALETDPALRQRLEALAADDVQQRDRYTSGQLAADVQRRRRAAAPPSRGWRYALLVPAAAAVFAIVVSRVPPTASTTGERQGSTAVEDDVRIKGVDAALVVYRATGGGSEPLRDAAIARPGDVIRLGYRVAEDVYGAIVSVDGRGIVTQHLPARGHDAAALHAGATVLLDEAFELDDAPRIERFYLVSARHPFDVAPVSAAIRAAAAADPPRPALAADLTFTTFALQKESRP